MEHTITITETEVLRVLIALDSFRGSSPTADNLADEITNQTGVEL